MSLRSSSPVRFGVPVAVAAAGLAMAVAAPAGMRSTSRETFAGRCSFSGHVQFTPALTTTAQSGRVRGSGTGRCSGRLERSGRTRTVNALPVRLAVQSAGSESCLRGVGTGAGYLRFGRHRLRFTYRELRAGPILVLRVAGARGGSAVAEGSVSTSANPVGILQACATSGLTGAPVDATLTTTKAISG